MIVITSTRAIAFSSPLPFASPPPSSPSLFHCHPSPPPLHSPISARRRLPSASHLSFPLRPSPPPPPPPSFLSPSPSTKLLCKAAEYVFPDPIPEFAEAETDRFRTYLLERLPKKKDLFGDSVEEIVGVCSEILSNFLHTEYGGPGTLMVVPFIDMADTLNERGLPGGPQAARAAVLWAQKHIDDDWDEWTGAAEKSL